MICSLSANFIITLTVINVLMALLWLTAHWWNSRSKRSFYRVEPRRHKLVWFWNPFRFLMLGRTWRNEKNTFSWRPHRRRHFFRRRSCARCLLLSRHPIAWFSLWQDDNRISSLGELGGGINSMPTMVYHITPLEKWMQVWFDLQEEISFAHEFLMKMLPENRKIKKNLQRDV